MPERWRRRLRPLAGAAVVGLAMALGACSSEGDTRGDAGPAATPTVTFNAADTTVDAGGSTMLTWSSTDATSCVAAGAWSGSKPTSGNESTGALSGNSTFTLSCSGTGGTLDKSVSITVNSAAPGVTLVATPASISAGGNSTLTWSSSDSTSCTASGGWTGSKATTGTQSVGPLNSTTSYTLSCTGSGGTTQTTATVTVAAVSTPTVSLSANPASVGVNGTSTLTWSSANATSCTASGGWSGSKTTSGSQPVGPLAVTTNFTLACTGAGGTSQRTAMISVTGSGSGGALAGLVDSSLIDLAGDNRIYVYAGSVSADDDDGDAGDPVQEIAVTQDANACTFSYALSGLAAGTYTLAFTRQAQNDRPDQNDTLTFTGTATVTVASTTVTHDFAAPSTLRVGPGRTYATVRAAAAAAGDGALIEVDPGTYNDDIVVWRQDNVTIRGVGGRPNIHGTTVMPFVSGDDLRNGKGLWVVNGSGIRVENIEFSGARVVDANGAGIRNEGSNLTVCGCKFHDNENGILGGAFGTFTIEYTEFTHNGIGEVGRTHNLYVDEGASAGDKLVYRYNYSHDVQGGGHLLKTRARENYILYSRIMDEADGGSSYSIDVPNGGLTYIVGNLIQQGPNTENSSIVSYGAEGLSAGRTHNLYLVNNTIANDRGSGTFLDVASGTALFRSINNLFVGSGTLTSGTQPQATTNLQTNSPGLVNLIAFDYRLATGSPAINAGTAPGSANGFALAPQFQYVHPTAREDRPASGAIDIGAYEYIP